MDSIPTELPREAGPEVKPSSTKPVNMFHKKMKAFRKKQGLDVSSDEEGEREEGI